MVQMGLHIQHGSQRCVRRYAKPDVELVQFSKISKIGTVLGDVAWTCGRMDYVRYELRIVGFPALVGMFGCTQFMASWDCSADYDLV